MTEERVGISVTDNVSPNIALKIREIGEQSRIAYERLNKLNQSVRGLSGIAANQARIEAATAKVAAAMARTEAAQARAVESQARVDAANNRSTASYTRLQAVVERTNASIQRAQDSAAASSARTAAAQAKASSAIEQAKAKEQRAILQVAVAQANAEAAAARVINTSLRTTKLQTEANTAAARSQTAAATATAAAARAQAAGTIAADNAASAAARAAAAQDRQALAALRLATAQQRQADAAQRAQARTEKKALDDASAAATAAAIAAQGNKGIAGLNNAMARGTLSAKQYRAALSLLPAQFTDIVVSLQGGQAPLTVLLQQGGQLKDMFGGVGAAMRAMAGYVLNLARNPFVLLAAAVGTALYQFYKFETQARTVNGLIAQFQATNRQDIGAGFITSLRNELDALPGVSRKVANNVIKDFASMRMIGGDQITQAARVVRDFAYATGKDLPDASKELAKALNSPLKGAEQLDEQLGFLTASEFRQIDAMQKSGKIAQAQTLILNKLEQRVKGLADEGMTPLQKATAEFGKQWAELMRTLDAPEALQGMEKMLVGIIDLFSKLINTMRELVKDAKIVWNELTADKSLGQQLEEQEKLLARMNSEGPGIMERGTWGAKKTRVQENINSLRAQIDARSSINVPTLPTQPVSPAVAKSTEAKIKESGIKDAEKLEKQAEKRAAALAKVNLELENEIRLQGMLGPERDAASRFAQIEETLIGKRVKLTEEETLAIKRKIDALISGKQVEEARNQVYEEAFGASRKYTAQLTALEQLEKRGVITAAEAARQRTMLTLQYEDSVSPLKRANDELDRSNALLKLNSDEMAIASAVEGKRQELLRQRGVVNEQELQQFRQRLVLQQELSRVQQAYNSIYQQTAGAQKELVAQQTALNMAYQNGLISLDVYGAKMSQIAIQMAQLKVNSGFGTFEDAAMAAMGRVADGYQGILSGLTNSFGDFFVTISDGFANSFGRAIVYGESLKDSMLEVVRQGVSALISSLVKLGIQYAVNAAIGQTVGTAMTAANVALAGTTAAAWAPAAAMVSLATFGSNAAAASAGIAATVATTQALSMIGGVGGFRKGGYTGNIGPDNIAGVVHGNEYVFDAQATSAIGVDTLDRLRASAGRSGYSANGPGLGGGGSSGKAVIVNIHPPEGVEARTQQTEDENTVKLDVFFDTIENGLAGRVRSRKGPFVDSMKEAFGASVKVGA